MAAIISHSGTRDWGHDTGEVALLLRAIGMGPNLSRILMFMETAEWVDSPTLQSACDLRQPEVSVAIKDLAERGCIEVRPERLGTRGRPRHLYRMHGSLQEAIEPWVREAEDQLETLEANLSEIRRRITAA